MSFKEVFEQRKKDERIVAEANKAYAVGFYIFLVGIVVDLYYKLMLFEVSVAHDLTQNSIYAFVSPLEFITFMLACIVSVVLMVRKGIFEIGKFSDVEKFPALHYAVISLVGALGAFVLLIGARLVAEVQLLGFESVSWSSGLSSGLLVAVFVLAGAFAANYLSFRVSRYRRQQELKKLESDE